MPKDFYPRSEHKLLLVSSAEIFQKAQETVNQCRKELMVLLPNVRIFHVGSSALNEGVTKGDIDLQLLCQEDDFETYRRKLIAIYPINYGAFQVEEGGQSFEMKSHTFSVGLHLTIENSPADMQRHHTQILKNAPELRRAYFELKHRWKELDMEAYRDAKAEFFARPEFRT